MFCSSVGKYPFCGENDDDENDDDDDDEDGGDGGGDGLYTLCRFCWPGEHGPCFKIVRL